MNLSAGYPLWFIRKGLPFDYPRLRVNTRADVLVIGGGISGALAAYQLCEAGMDVLVADGRTIGLGSTCASTSLLQYELDIPLARLREQIGQKKAERAYRLCTEAVTGLRTVADRIGFGDYEEMKSVYFAAVEKDIPFLLTEIDARSAAGIEVEWLDRQQLEGRYGIAAPAAILSSPAAQTDAYSFTHALHRFNMERGARVYDRTLVTAVQKMKGGFSVRTRDGHTIRCAHVVYATGYEATEQISRRIVSLSSTYVVAGEQMQEDHPLFGSNIIAWSTGNPYLYFRTTKDRRLVAGGRDEPLHSPRKRDALLPRKTRQLVRDIGKVLPTLPFNTEFAWTGTFGSTKDSLPYIGAYPRRPGRYYSLGFGGNGITFGYIASQIITTAMIKGEAVPDAVLFNFNR